MEVSVELNTAAASLSVNNSGTYRIRCSLDLESVWTFRRRENLFHIAELELRKFQFVAQSLFRIRNPAPPTGDKIIIYFRSALKETCVTFSLVEWCSRGTTVKNEVIRTDGLNHKWICCHNIPIFFFGYQMPKQDRPYMYISNTGRLLLTIVAVEKL